MLCPLCPPPFHPQQSLHSPRATGFKEGERGPTGLSLGSPQLTLFESATPWALGNMFFVTPSPPHAVYAAVSPWVGDPSGPRQPLAMLGGD